MKVDASDAVRKWSVCIAVGTFLFGILLFVFWNKIFYESLSGDGAQAFYLSRLTGILPNWSMENGFSGFNLNFMLFAYPNALLLSILGPVEAAVRLPLLLYVLITYFVSILIVTFNTTEHRTSLGGISRSSQIQLSVLLALFIFYTIILFGFYATYNPYLADISEPTCTDVFMALWLLVSIHGLVTGSYWRYTGANLAMTLSLPSGLIWVFLIKVAGFLTLRDRRKPILKHGLIFLFGFASLWLGYEVYKIYQPMGEGGEYGMSTLLNRVTYLITQISMSRVLFVTKYALITCGLVPLILFFFLFRSFDPVSRFMALCASLYAVSVLVMGHAIHYFIPYALLAPLPLIRFVLQGNQTRSKNAIKFAITIVVVFLLVHIWPDSSRFYKTSREFSERVVIAYESENEIQILGKLEALHFFFPPHGIRADNGKNWGVSTWVLYHYANSTEYSNSLEVDDHIDYIFSSRPLDTESFFLLYHEPGNYFYARSVGILISDMRRETAQLELPDLLEDSRIIKSDSEKMKKRSIQAYTMTISKLTNLSPTSERERLIEFFERRIRELRNG